MSRTEIYAGRVVNLGLERVRLPNGVDVELEVIRHPGASAVVPLHADGSVTLVHQYRHAGGGMHYELPAGLLEADEQPERCAARELAEEVGLRAAQLRPLGPIHTTPGFTDERIHMYMATGLTQGPTAQEADEYIEIVRMPLADAIAMVMDGRITDGKTICGLMMTARIVGV